jgi:hypothetical protein
MALTVAAVDAIRADLAAVPPKEASAREVTRLEAIARMRGEVMALRERGYSWDEVAELLSSKGCRVTAATRRTELSRKGNGSKSKAPERRQRVGGAEGAGGAIRPSAVEKPAAPVKAAGPPPKAAAEMKPGGFVVREDSEI